ncbi:AAA family ATPase [Bdellovibrio bacteriovorus]|uniref:AAA family ATPase n=1 Tax=Bdellovibrio bacteriovorus TaxID=959 RepID=A0A150WQS9_BDEBC|nr:AAA family ATPase [Bdellovibrio bacteriovorus]KYG66684.1 AAA family ATPase [Bdellovibrio bacteriovorus]
MNHKFQALISEASKIVLDKEAEVRLAVTCLLAGGHLLIEDLPGVGKTTLVQVLGRLIGLKTRRVQFTIDLLPADVIGGQVYHPQEQKFHFHPGPLFSQLVMADELNRASPRTQSALLQAMEEGEVSVDGINHVLPKPFYVIATQNPHQQTGTFPLPESQLDRFLMSLELNHAQKETEVKIFQGEDPRQQLQKIEALFNEQEVEKLIKEVEKVKVSTIVAQYVGDLLEISRKPGFEGNPLSTRAGLALTRAAKAWAIMDGRDYVRPEDVQSVLIPVLGHRLGGNHGIKRGREWAYQLQKSTAVPV